MPGTMTYASIACTLIVALTLLDAATTAVPKSAAAPITGLRLPAAAEVSLIVYRDDAALTSTTLRPEYSSDEINGPGCPGCQRATEEVTMPF